MIENTGFISLHRTLKNHWIWKDSNKLKWWLDILLTVNYKPAKVNLGNEVFECQRGEALMSILSWAERWKVSKDTARNFLKLLEKDHMIECVSIGKSTRLTVCNYDTYQTNLHVNSPDAVRTPSDNSPQLNKVNKEIKDNVDFNVFWDLYGKKVGARKKCEAKWHKLSGETQTKIIEVLPVWKKQFTELQFQPFPETFLNQERWNDEVLAVAPTGQLAAQIYSAPKKAVDHKNL